jgi:NADPH2:quinone reductase
MRAIVITAPGADNNLRVTEAPAPVPGPGEVLVDVAYCGCNFADTMIAKGTYPHPKGYPIIGGLEISGRVAKLGPGVQGIEIGDAVAAFSEEAGGFAEQCVVAAERLVRIPGEIGLDIAAAFPIQALTAWHILHNVSVPGRATSFSSMRLAAGSACLRLSLPCKPERLSSARSAPGARRSARWNMAQRR